MFILYSQVVILNFKIEFHGFNRNINITAYSYTCVVYSCKVGLSLDRSHSENNECLQS